MSSANENSVLTLERRGHVLLMGLNRPQKRNAFNIELLMELARAHEQLERDDELRCGVLFAHGEHFTGGLDLAEVGPVAGDACHMARSGSPDSVSGRLHDVALHDIHPNPAQPQALRRRVARCPCGVDPRARRVAADHRSAQIGRGVRADRGREALARLTERRKADDSGACGATC